MDPTKLRHPARQQIPSWNIVFLSITFFALAAWSWRKTADILVDFGVQLYVPWQLAAGKILYHDVAYLPGGPLSQYFNAALFKMFGTSLTTLMIANLVITAAMVTMIFRFFHKFANSTCATAVSFAVLTLFAFAELASGGNYNYVTPYSHEVFHAMVIAILAVMFFSDWALHDQSRKIVAAGICTGLVFLAKPEVFLAVMVTTMLAFVIHLREHRNVQGTMKAAGAFLLASLVPPVIAFLLLQTVQPLDDALKSVAWAWIPLLTTSAANNPFYRWCMGLDYPLGNLLLSSTQLISFIIGTALCIWCARSSSTPLRHRILSAAILLILVVVIWRTKWRGGGLILFLLAPTIFFLLLRQWWRMPERKQETIPALLWAGFAVAMMAKMGFFSRIWHYGAFLGMPATILAIFFCFHILPRYAAQLWDANPNRLIGLFTLLLFTVAASVIAASQDTYSIKDVPVGHGGDRLYFYRKYHDPTGILMARGLEWIEKNTPADATLAVVPQGAMLNYLSRRKNPTPYITLVLPEWLTFGEDQVLAAYQATPPDYMVITRFDASSSEYGVGHFGSSTNYGKRMLQWIEENYAHAESIRYRKGDPFGMDILIHKRNQTSGTLPDES